MKQRNKHLLRQASICIPIALAAGWSIPSVIMPLMEDHFWTAALYVMLTATCFDMTAGMIYPKFAWTRNYEPPTFDFNDPKRCNFGGIQHISRAHRMGASSEHLFPTIVVGYEEVINQSSPIPRLWPSEEELMKFCGDDPDLRDKYYKAWREANLKSWNLHNDRDWMVRHLDYATNYEEQERMRKLFLGVWEPKHPLYRYASTEYLERVFEQIEQIGYADVVFKELEQQSVPIDPDLLYDILREFILMVKVNPNEKAIFKPFPETHA
jgi:hypothetical protein